MAATLRRVVEQIYNDTYHYRRCWGGNTNPPYATSTAHKFLRLPLDEPEIEVPCFLMGLAGDALNRYDTLCADLYHSGTSTGYSTLDANLRSALNEDWSCKLIKIPVKGEPSSYWATCGAIFDPTLHPLMICSWKVKIAKNNLGNKYFVLDQPILRLDRNLWEMSNSISRFLTGKFTKEVLGIRAYYDRMSHTGPLFNVQVIIDTMPYDIHDAVPPSILTTDKMLLQLVNDHINDIAL